MCELWIRWGVVVMVSSLPTEGQSRGTTTTRERAVPTKSWNVRPEWNSCCTPCPDGPTACDRENNRINNHSLTHTLPPSPPLPLSLSERKTAPLSTTCCGLWTVGTFRISLQPLDHKTWTFPIAWFWAVSWAANGKHEEDWGRARRRCVCVCVLPSKADRQREGNMMCEFNRAFHRTPRSWTEPHLRCDARGRLLLPNLNNEGV